MLRAALFLLLFVSGVTIAVSLVGGREQADERLNADRHREAIREVESVLYRSTPAEFGDGDRVSDALQRLADELAPPDAPYLERRRALRLYELIGLASGMGDAGYALPDLGFLRIEWERQRDALFVPAPWFGRSDSKR
jgi:hypothetical protein